MVWGRFYLITVVKSHAFVMGSWILYLDIHGLFVHTFLGSGILTNVFDYGGNPLQCTKTGFATIVIVLMRLPNTFVLWRGLMHWVGGWDLDHILSF